jgi:hypothetical protein
MRRLFVFERSTVSGTSFASKAEPQIINDVIQQDFKCLHFSPTASAAWDRSWFLLLER